MDNIINLLDKIIVDGQEIDLQSLALINGTLNVGHQKDVIVEYIFKDETQIPSDMFKNLKQLKYAYFPKAGNIKTIGERAFANSNLTYIDKLSDINYIGAQAFSYTKLTYVYNGDAPDSIAANAWSYINTLTNDFKNILSQKYPYIDFGNNSEPIIHDDPDDPIINVTTNIINVTNNGGEYEITYTITNPVIGINISAITNVDWITNFNYNTSGQVKFTVNVQETNGQQRSGNITLSYGNASKTITVIQAAGGEVIISNPIINVSQRTINSSYTGGTYSIDYTITNPIQGSSINARTPVNWVSDFNYTSNKVQFNVSAQQVNASERTTTITLSYPNAEDIIVTLTQAANNTVISTPIINVSPTNLNCEHTGGEYTINYSIDNPIQGSSINVRTSADWISNITYTSTKIKFNVNAQEENATERTTTITLSYPNANDVIITFTQGAYIANGGGPEPTDKNGWYRVESSNWLNIGDRIIIVAADDDYALSTTQNSSNRSGIEITKSNDGSYRTCTISNDVQEFILENGTVNSTFALRCINGTEVGKYVYASSNSSNQLKSYATLNDNGSFLISFESDYSANIVAQGTNSRNTIKFYSSTNNKMFSCYESGQKPILIYKYYTTDANAHPIINVTSDTINVPNNSDEYEIDYTISNSINGIEINATTNADCITNIDTSINNKIKFTISAQDINTPERTATITLSYIGASSVMITIIQAAGEVVSTDPAINVNKDLIEVIGTGGLYSISYSIANPNDGDVLTATCIDNWVNNINVQSNLVSFNVDAQVPNSTDRTTTLTLSYPGAENVLITISQSVNTVQPLDIIANVPNITGIDFGWNANNALNVFAKESNTNDSYTGNHKFVITENNLLANRFTADDQNPFDPSLNYDIHVSYPYNANILDDPNTTAYVRIGAYSSTSSVTQNGYNDTNHLKTQNCPLYGSVDNIPGYNEVTINMNYLLSIIKIRVTNTSDKEIIVKNVSVTAPEDIIGSYTVDYFNSTPIFTPEDPTLISNTINLKVKDGTRLANDGTAYADFYVAIKPFTLLTTDSLTITVNGYSKTITPQADIVFGSGIINSFDFDYDIVINLSEPSNVTGWYRVEKEEWLQPGDKVVIVSNSDDYAMSATQGNNNRSGIQITKSTDGAYQICTIDDSVQQFIIEDGTQNNTIAFKCINGESNKYIYAAASGNNYLRSSNSLTDDASFSFELDHQGNATLIAQGTNTTNHLQYYKTTTTHTFSCYTGNNLDVAIYKYYSVAVVNNPSINTSASINIPNTAGNNTINYTITDAISGASIIASTTADWITNFDYSTANKVIFTVTGQENNAPERTATITLSYPNANDVTITVVQAAGEVNGGGGEPTGKQGWYRVESVDWLHTRDTVIIAAKDEDYAMSTTQNTNNRGVADIYNRTMDGAYEICSPSSSVQRFELVAGTINDTFAFKFLDDNSQVNYIYAASNNSSGYLRSYPDDELDAKGSFNITFESDYTANIVSNCTSTRNTIRYYKSGDNRSFNCYPATQKPVLIYKLYE